MSTKPKVVQKDDRFSHLTKLQNTTRKIAIILAFLGVFIWFFKIVLF